MNDSTQAHLHRRRATHPRTNTTHNLRGPCAPITSWPPMSAVREGPETKLTVRGMAPAAEARADLLPRALVAADQVLLAHHHDAGLGQERDGDGIVRPRGQHQRARLGDGGGGMAQVPPRRCPRRGRASSPAPARCSKAARRDRHPRPPAPAAAGWPSADTARSPLEPPRRWRHRSRSRTVPPGTSGTAAAAPRDLPLPAPAPAVAAASLGARPRRRAASRYRWCQAPCGS